MTLLGEENVSDRPSDRLRGGSVGHLAQCLSHPDRLRTSYAYYLYNVVPSHAGLYWD